MKTTLIEFSEDQLIKIIAGLKALPQETDSLDFETATPHELVEMIEGAMLAPSGDINSFVC